MRVSAGLIVVDAPTPYAADPDGYLQKGLALRDDWIDHPLANFCMAPHAPYTVGDRSLEKVATYAAQLDLPIHMHIHETEHEIEHSIALWRASAGPTAGAGIADAEPDRNSCGASERQMKSLCWPAMAAMWRIAQVRI
jgi:cytosine/adenosine deaminase-related metal-dependent hydrolase